MFVVKRDGTRQPMRFDNVTERLRVLVEMPPRLDRIDPCGVTKQVCAGIVDGMSTRDVDELCTSLCADKSNVHPQYAHLAARLLVSNLHKERFRNPHTVTFADVVARLADDGRVADSFAAFVAAHADTLNAWTCYDRDYALTYFGLRTLQNGYLLPGELPQDLFMRVAVALHHPDLAEIEAAYTAFSLRRATHATPTLFNAGTRHPQLASCFLTCVDDDSVEGIYDTVKRCALISKYAGGLGIDVTRVRGRGQRIRGTSGRSEGVVPMLKVFEATAKYINQGGKRKGSFAVYLEPWHRDVLDWALMRRNDGVEDLRCRELFYGLWIPDLFMRRVRDDASWTLFCPHDVPQLLDLCGDAFDAEYARLEKFVSSSSSSTTPVLWSQTLRARDLWRTLLETKATTGVPYMCFKDAANHKSNQRHLGVIRCSNLCTEIVQYSGPGETAVCNLASLSLSAMLVLDPDVVDATAAFRFDFDRLADTTRVLVRSLNRTIDIGFYPTECAQRSNLRHRPIGIGVQGWANVLFALRLPFDSDEAAALNRRIFETVYWAALDQSADLAARDGAYASFAGSPASQGLLSQDLWERTDEETLPGWASVRAKIAAHGLRNSLLTAPMPTASTAQILGNYEAFEPVTSNLYTRRVLSGEFHVVNEYLVRDLEVLGLWNDATKAELLRHDGSVQSVPNLPDALKSLYRTAYEISPRVLVERSADRAPWIDQSQSLNLFVSKPTYKLLSSVHMLAWQLGLKTGSYYIRSKPSVTANKVTLPVAATVPDEDEEDRVCVACSA